MRLSSELERQFRAARPAPFWPSLAIRMGCCCIESKPELGCAAACCFNWCSSENQSLPLPSGWQNVSGRDCPMRSHNVIQVVVGREEPALTLLDQY